MRTQRKTNVGGLTLRALELIKLASIALTLLAGVSTAFATVRYVDATNSSPTPPYTNWATAAVTIQEAVDAAVTADEVVVNNGVYAVGQRETFDSHGHSEGLNRVAITKAISLRSLNGPQFTVIDGLGGVRCASLTAGASLSGFTLTNGAAGTGYFSGYGGAVHCESPNAFLTNCLVTGSFSTDYGGGVYGGTLHNCTLAGNSTPTAGGGACWSTLYNCSLTGNFAGSGAGAWDSTLYKCTLSGNSAWYWGGGAGGGTLYNCTVTGNAASSYGGGAYAGTLHNCTVTDNSAHDAGGGAYSSTLYNCTLTGNSSTDRSGGASWSALYNCIVYFNTAATEANYDADSDLYYCCTTPLPPAGTGNSSFDPQLASANRLNAASPCRAAGSTAYATGTDIDGEPWGNPPSIGCDEYHAGALTGPLTVSLLADYTNVAVGYPVALTALIGGRTTESVWDFGDGMAVSNRPYASHAWAAPGDYLVLLRAFNESLPAGVSATLIVHVVNSVHYVALHNPTPASPYTSWATAATNIQDAVDAGLPGALVLVTNGVYGNCVEVNTPLRLRSVTGPQFTVIAGEGTYVYLADGASLSGFTLTNGWGLGCDPAGVASNCVIIGNSAWQGGGAYGGTLYNCILTGNSANSGGGAYDCTLYNCTLTGNSAEGGGGGTYGGTLYNCIVYYNEAAADPNYSDSGLNYCCTSPQPASGVGNLTNLPMFVDCAGGNLHLQTNSPCINAGLNAYAVDPTDLDGRPRIVEGTVDIGAYEFQGPGMGEFIAWLQGYGLPTDGSADYTDPDGDAFNNWQEWRGGCDPTNAQSAPIRITDQPASQTVTVGHNATFSVTALGTLPMTHQWHFNGTNDVAGATNTLLIVTSVQLADAGYYSVTVSNAYGAIISSNALLEVNQPPVADASATLPVVISAHGTDATVLLDGSRSSDPDGDLLHYLWFSTLNSQPSTPIASGVVAVIVLPVGTHSIDLIVSDGLATSTNRVVVAVLTSTRAVQRLISMVNICGIAHPKPLTATLDAALASINRGNHGAAANQLHAFQNKVQAQVAPLDSALGATFSQAAQQIIDVLSGTDTGAGGRQHGRFSKVDRQLNGRVHLHFSAQPGPVYILETSTNLVDWQMIGVAQDQGDGTFAFEDVNAVKFPCRYYRIKQLTEP